MPEPDPTLGATSPRLRDRLSLAFARLALAWRARREGRGRAVSLRREGRLVRVEDGLRAICVPHLRCVPAFERGIDTRLAAVAAKYLGGTAYVPRPGDAVVDVGAGIGEFTLWAAGAGAQVVAFEPDPLAFACLARNTANLADVELLPLAIWKEHAHLRLHGSIDTIQSSLIEDGRPHARNASVEAWPLDRLQVLVRLPVIDFLKVDGEGVEPEILAGGVRTLRRTRVIAIDLGATDRRPNLRARVEALLESNGFRAVPHDRGDTILALNTAMVGPFSSRALDRPGS